MDRSMEMTFTLRGPDLVREPARPSSLQAAVARALQAAQDPPTAYATPTFHLLDTETAAAVAWLNARLLEPEVGVEGARAAYEQWQAIPGWIVVTCPRSEDPEQAERNQEDGRTAAQRASLSLWSDNIPTNWIADRVTQEPALYEMLEVDFERETVVGILVFGHEDHPRDLDDAV